MFETDFLCKQSFHLNNNLAHNWHNIFCWKITNETFPHNILDVKTLYPSKILIKMQIVLLYKIFSCKIIDPSIIYHKMDDNIPYPFTVAYLRFWMIFEWILLEFCFKKIQKALGGRREIKVVVTCCRPDTAGLTVLCST